MKKDKQKIIEQANQIMSGWTKEDLIQFAFDRLVDELETSTNEERKTCTR